MVESDWRKILNFSQKELNQIDKEQLCESLAWMEADDIEINFTDLKTLFRLSQDILKFKGEQVNTLLGQIESLQGKNGSRKHKQFAEESPARSVESPLDTIAHQEEIIKVNKEILEQLYFDISELEGKKNKLGNDKKIIDRDSDSSRDALSELDAVRQLEKEVSMKNKHIRKLIVDIKVFEEENGQLKDKISVLKDKLKEATQIIEKLTEQLYSLNSNCCQLKEVLGNCEQEKSQLTTEIETLKIQLRKKESVADDQQGELKAKIQHWKNIARSKKSENEAVTNLNAKLKEDLKQIHQETPTTKLDEAQELQYIELKNKLVEASNKILQSAHIIELLKTENYHLKSTLKATDSVSIARNETDEGKEKVIVKKLKRKIHSLTCALQTTENLLSMKEKEIIEITSQLHLLENGEEGLNTFLSDFKSAKRQLKLKDEGLKSFVKEINALNNTVDNLQLENEALREKLNIPRNEKVPTTGILKKYHDLEMNAYNLNKKIFVIENKLVALQLENREKDETIHKLKKSLQNIGVDKESIEQICEDFDNEVEPMPTDGGGESSTALAKLKQKTPLRKKDISESNAEMKTIIDENEGLRKGLKEILDVLLENNTSTGNLAVQCPSLEAVLTSMEARHAAGWFAPHMAVVLELRSAIGGRDALLTALNEARKETYEVIIQLSKESQKSIELEEKIFEMEKKNKEQSLKIDIIDQNSNSGDLFNDSGIIFGNWMSQKEIFNIDISDKSKIDNIISQGHNVFQNNLKEALTYFHKQYKNLYDKMTDIAIKTSDEQNKWIIQEEKYKAEIESLKSQFVVSYDNDQSDNSVGVIDIPNLNVLQRKCSFLEESYKYVRTLNENLKNEYLESKRSSLVMMSEYENKIQHFILNNLYLTDRLRNSISLEIFQKLNEEYNDILIKYRQLIDDNLKKIQGSDTNLYDKLENERMTIINDLRRELGETENNNTLTKNNTNNSMFNAERNIILKQLQNTCEELIECQNKLRDLNKVNIEIQISEKNIIEKTLNLIPKEELLVLEEQIENTVLENKTLKDQCRHVESQLDIALIQLQDKQQRQMNTDMEINMLKHQVLDLQSTSDNKAIIARLSGEILISHLHASDNHKIIERLNSSLNKEKQLRLETEEMLQAREKIFNVYAARYEHRFRNMFQIIQTLRQQYQGCVPLVSVENYLNNIDDSARNKKNVDDTLNEVEDLRSILIAKHEVFDEILKISKTKCITDVDNCPHQLQLSVQESIHVRELDHYKKKISILDQSRDEIVQRCNSLEKTLILLNQGFDKPALENVIERKIPVKIPHLELEEVHSDDEPSSRRSETIILKKPQILKSPKRGTNIVHAINTIPTENSLPGSPIKTKSAERKKVLQVSNVFVQTIPNTVNTKSKLVQTDKLTELNKLKTFEIDNNKKSKEIAEALSLAKTRTEEILSLQSTNAKLEDKINTLEKTIVEKDEFIGRSKKSIDYLTKELETIKVKEITNKTLLKESASDESKNLLNALKELEDDKNTIVREYKEMLQNERDEYIKMTKELQNQISELQMQLDGKKEVTYENEAVREISDKFTVKIVELEDQCFKVQSELDEYKNNLTTAQCERERWKQLASERLTKMEQLNCQLEERHCNEVESYKAESQHWLTQLGASEREQTDLRTRLSELRATHSRQLAERDTHIDQLRQTIHNLKSQIANMQTLISVNDPSFDLSAIVEVEEPNEGMSQSSDQLELKFDASFDEFQGDLMNRIPASSSSIWQEPVVERLRREKQLAGKQNALLRRQIKALAGRERRARLEAQNLKNQMYRFTSTNSKSASGENTALHNKIASLQAQLVAARRDTQSSVALWDKWKRSQQTAERWQVRYEEKCQEIRKLETSLNYTKSAITRLEREKRTLLSRTAELKNDDKQLSLLRAEDKRLSESASGMLESASSIPVRVSAQSLMERVEAQQRRIAALELAEKGNEPLLSEYEKALAEITSLKGQILKLESSLLEAQIRTPIKSSPEPKPELEYWKSYCEMLKEENVQLSLRLSAIEATPSVGQQRVNDLEQTVLTLRGLVSKLQAEQKSTSSYKRNDSRPNSGRSLTTDKGKNQLETYRIEIANLKRSIGDKDMLLDKSKEMLKVAAERVEQLLRENVFLRRKVDDESDTKTGYLSA